MSSLLNAGAKSAWWWRARGTDLSTSGTIATGTAGAANVLVNPTTVPASQAIIYVQTITVAITTLGAQTITFQDTAGTPVVIAVIPASQAVGAPVRFDFGARGIALTAGKNLSIVGSAAPAYSYSIEAYADGPDVTQATTVDRTV